ESALQMMRADAGLFAQRLERLRFFVMFVDCMTYAAHEFDLRICRAGLLGPTTLARTETLAFRRFGQLVEADLFTSRSARRTRRPAIDTSRLHGKDKAAIARTVT